MKEEEKLCFFMGVVIVVVFVAVFVVVIGVKMAEKYVNLFFSNV